MASQPQGVPASVDDPLLEIFTGRFGLTNTPQVLQYSDQGYDADFCHLSAKHCAITKGGRRVHGWAIWKFDDARHGEVVVGEHHSVWEDANGCLVDVMPPKFGASNILFVRDDASVIEEFPGGFNMWADRTTILDYPFFFNGHPLEEPGWGLPDTNSSFQSYCSKHGMSPSAIATDSVYG